MTFTMITGDMSSSGQTLIYNCCPTLSSHLIPVQPIQPSVPIKTPPLILSSAPTSGASIIKSHNNVTPNCHHQVENCIDTINNNNNNNNSNNKNNKYCNNNNVVENPKLVHPRSRGLSATATYTAIHKAVNALNRLDDFTCEKIGAGFFSEVFKVTHRVTGQVMVLKMNMSHSNRPNMLREVQLMNRLNHPNILKFMGVCVHEGQLHALTEYINDGSLEQLLQNKAEELSWPTRIKLAQDVAKGMNYLHTKIKVFHRDLTSKNVLVKREENELTAVVGDFGLADKIPDPLDRLPTVGSPYWMAPECLTGKWYNQKADVFSYGIILCEIIARIEADPDILPRTENFGLDYVLFENMCPDCPKEFLTVAFHCCKVDPKDRSSFAEVVEQLNVILESQKKAELYRKYSISESAVTTNNKALHRRSKSEDTLFGLFTNSSPSDKARCHYQGLFQGLSVGEVMSKGDPYYTPSDRTRNPFALFTEFRDGRKILASSRELFSSCFELPSPSAASTPPITPYAPDIQDEQEIPKLRRCRSHAETRNSSPSPSSSYLSSSSLGTPASPVVPPMLDNCLPHSLMTEPSQLQNDEGRCCGCSGDPSAVDDIVESNHHQLGHQRHRRGSCESGFFSVCDGERTSISTCDLSPPSMNDFDDVIVNIEKEHIGGNVINRILCSRVKSEPGEDASSMPEMLCSSVRSSGIVIESETDTEQSDDENDGSNSSNGSCKDENVEVVSNGQSKSEKLMFLTGSNHSEKPAAISGLKYPLVQRSFSYGPLTTATTASATATSLVKDD